MARSVLVFISHASEDKEPYVDPIVHDLEDCFINIWIDSRRILPGDNLRKSIFRDGLDKADVVLLFFTAQSLKSSWVDREIKHVLREETNRGNNFDLNKIISIFDSQDTYNEVAKRYPELTDDLLHLMPVTYTKKQLGQLISAIWAKYLSLQGGDVETQRVILAKDKELFQKDKDIQSLQEQLQSIKRNNPESFETEAFEQYVRSEKIKQFINCKDRILSEHYVGSREVPALAAAKAFGLMEAFEDGPDYVTLTEKGKRFFEWYLLNNQEG